MASKCPMDNDVLMLISPLWMWWEEQWTIYCKVWVKCESLQVIWIFWCDEWSFSWASVWDMFNEHSFGCQVVVVVTSPASIIRNRRHYSSQIDIWIDVNRSCYFTIEELVNNFHWMSSLAFLPFANLFHSFLNSFFFTVVSKRWKNDCGRKDASIPSGWS